MSYLASAGASFIVLVGALGCTTVNNQYDDDGTGNGGWAGQPAVTGSGAGPTTSAGGSTSNASGGSSSGGSSAGGSSAGGSSAGGSSSGGGAGPTVVINEVAPDGSPEDWVELKNVSGAPLDTAGWSFTDSDPTNVYTFPPGTTIASDGYLVVDRWDGAGGGAPANQFDFGLGKAANSDELHLYDDQAAAIDSCPAWTVEIVDPQTFGRLPDGTGPFQVFDNTNGDTKGSANE